jgi:two-component system, chemotaxis family, chemotaxis protein CheY
MASRAETVSVLVLDDHRFMQQVHRAILAGLGVRKITLTATVDEALDYLRNEPFDLVIADYRLAEESGAEFTRLVRGARDGIDRFTPVIACTADTTPKVVRELRDAGVDEILAKPVSARSMCDKINTVANARRPFIAAPVFFGPDRRRRDTAPPTAERRSGDQRGATRSPA